MNPLVEINLTLILFLPWFAILSALFWLYPKQPRDRARIAFDLGALTLSALAFVWSIHWSQGIADVRYGKMWPQVLATAVGYGVFLGAMTLAFVVRWRWLSKRDHLSDPA